MLGFLLLLIIAWFFPQVGLVLFLAWLASLLVWLVALTSPADWFTGPDVGLFLLAMSITFLLTAGMVVVLAVAGALV